VLENSGFNPDAPVLFILEGVLMYLPEALAFDLLQTLNHLSQSNSELLFSAIRDDESLFNPRVKRAMERNNSPFLWAKELTPLKTELIDLGFSVVEQETHEDFSSRFTDKLPKPKAFTLYEYYNYAVKA
jgi:O-methyltransferase involved in polyketide biosynthesis